MKFKYKKDLPKRLDKYLADTIDSTSRNQLQKLIKKGYVKVDGNINKKRSFKLKKGNIIEVTFPEEPEIKLEPKNIELDILYEDDFLAVVNKPSGMLVHPTKHQRTNTLANALLYHFENVSELQKIRPGIVHRLDKYTSGIMIVAKNNKTHRKLSKMIQNKEIKRKYWSILKGSLSKPTGEIIAPIGRNPSNRTKMDVVLDGKFAHTNYVVLENFNNYVLVEFSLKTGRTHQIRVHAQFIGAPVIGDPKYGGTITDDRLKFIKRQLLHSKKLSFEHPITDEKIDLESDLPEDFSKALKILKN